MSEEKAVESAEVAVRLYAVRLCDLCVTGAGGYCHVPGCALIRKSAPDRPLVKQPGIPHEDYDEVVLLEARDQAIRAERDREIEAEQDSPDYVPPQLAAFAATGYKRITWTEHLAALADAKAAQDKATRAEIAEKVCTCLALPHWKTCRAVELGILPAEGEKS
jgi:hypothetical protein